MSWPIEINIYVFLPLPTAVKGITRNPTSRSGMHVRQWEKERKRSRSGKIRAP